MRATGCGGVIGLMLMLLVGLGVIAPAQAQAQEPVFVQIESNATLGAAEARARAYAQVLTDVNAFRARTGLYAIALGPYERGAAQALKQREGCSSWSHVMLRARC